MKTATAPKRHTNSEVCKFFDTPDGGQVGINATQGLFVLPECGGFSCLGFQVADRRRVKMLEWLGLPVAPVPVGTLESFLAYREAYAAGFRRYQATGKRCPAELTPELVGLEGARVRVLDADGAEYSRFWVGRSTGWTPIHLAIARRNCHGGGSAFIPAGGRVEVVTRSDRPAARL